LVFIKERKGEEEKKPASEMLNIYNDVSSPIIDRKWEFVCVESSIGQRELTMN
jgi:hypothetical protein